MIGASVGWGIAIGASLVLGSLVAAWTRLPERLAAAITAFGGGILLAAVALELVPEADERAGLWLTAAGACLGALLYVGADAWLSRDESMEAMRRSGHAAAAGLPMRMLARDHAAAAPSRKASLASPSSSASWSGTSSRPTARPSRSSPAATRSGSPS